MSSQRATISPPPAWAGVVGLWGQVNVASGMMWGEHRALDDTPNSPAFLDSLMGLSGRLRIGNMAGHSASLSLQNIISGGTATATRLCFRPRGYAWHFTHFVQSSSWRFFLSYHEERASVTFKPDPPSPDRGMYGPKLGRDVAWEGTGASGILVMTRPNAGGSPCAFLENAIRCSRSSKRIYLTSLSHN